MNEQVSDQVTV